MDNHSHEAVIVRESLRQKIECKALLSHQGEPIVMTVERKVNVLVLRLEKRLWGVLPHLLDSLGKAASYQDG
jgi:hypothetical protein